MPTQLSGGTLGLKFMQRAAAKKVAAAGAPPSASVDIEQSKPSSSSTPAQLGPEQEDTPFPVASTSKLPRVKRPYVAAFESGLSEADLGQNRMVTTEASFLAFPILSNAYGASTSTIGSNANGRMSFGKVRPFPAIYQISR